MHTIDLIAYAAMLGYSLWILALWLRLARARPRPRVLVPIVLITFALAVEAASFTLISAFRQAGAEREILAAGPFIRRVAGAANGLALVGTHIWWMLLGKDVTDGR